MTDEHWEFWRRQLIGQQPETTPGTPHAGYFIQHRRWTVDNDDPNRRPGDPRKKVRKEALPVAIWHDAGWHMLIGDEEYYRDPDKIDDVFSRVCRNAIDYDVYEEMRRENKRSSERDFDGPCESAGRNPEPV